MKPFNLIFTNSGVHLSSKKYNSWREIQCEYENYSASIDFETLEDIKEYIIMDYKLNKEYVDKLITNFIESKLMTIELKLCGA